MQPMSPLCVIPKDRPVPVVILHQRYGRMRRYQGVFGFRADREYFVTWDETTKYSTECKV